MPAKILTVDDSRTIRLIVARAFQHYDCVVYEAGNGEEGLEVATREQPDLILLDFTMPVMDGVTMLTRLKANPALRAIPVIMLTAESGRDTILEISRIGVSDYLVKPFKETQLVEKAARAIPNQLGGLSHQRKATVPEPNNYQELARRYGLEPVPESVLHLTEIVSRQNADLDDVARLISRDAGLTQRLLRAANPAAEDEADYDIQTVDEALMRNGLSCPLLLAMGRPLAQALIKTFHTMLQVKMESIDRNSVLPLQGEHVLGTIGFSGRASGLVQFRLSPESAGQIASGILGSSPPRLADSPEVHDAIGELLNIITGNFKSNLCDAGLDCRLQTPRVTLTEEFGTPNAPGGSLERMTFHAGRLILYVDVWVNPWGDG